jgi:iron complex outermembrane receptor protein
MKPREKVSSPIVVKPLVIAMVMALGASNLVFAAQDDNKTLTDLQTENARLRKELEALRQQQGQAKAAPASAAPAAPAAATETTAPVVAPSKAVQQDEPSLATVMVTSRNREEIAQDVPLPVQVIGGEQLERDGVKSIWDLTGKAPNLQLNPPGENARKVSISIRGVGRNGANDSAEGSVSTIVDGVPLYYSGQAWSDYVDLDRIEVLRGPQGTLIGKNTTLGAVNIITRPPSFKPAHSFSISAGNQNDLTGRFSSTGPIVDGLLAYRAAFVADRADGYYTNTYQSY